jgi:hypothetical protein
MSGLATACARAQGCSRLMAAGAAALDNNDNNTAPRHVSKPSLRRMSCERGRVVMQNGSEVVKWQEKKASQPERCLTSFAGQSVQ